MLGRPRRLPLPALPVVLCALLAAPASAWAANGLYLQLGVGYGEWTGRELATQERDGPGDLPELGEGCCPSGTLSLQTRIGFSILGIVAPEALAFGSGWNFGDPQNGGGGLLGGGLRLYPLGILDKAGVLPLKGFPLDFSIAASGAYAIVGANDAFAYEGWAFGLDFTAEYIVWSFLSIGLKLDVWFPSFDAFARTNFSADRGRCLDETGAQIVNDPATDPNLPVGGVINRRDKGNLCPAGGRGPNTTVISPQLLLTFRFDVL